MTYRNRAFRLAAAALLAATAVTLAACTPTRDNAPKVTRIEGDLKTSVRVHTIELSNGSTVLCIWEGIGNAGGLSCDWTNKTTPQRVDPLPSPTTRTSRCRRTSAPRMTTTTPT